MGFPEYLQVYVSTRQSRHKRSETKGLRILSTPYKGLSPPLAPQVPNDVLSIADNL